MTVTTSPGLELLTKDQVGKILGRSGDWVSRQANAGEIGYVRIGQSLRFRVSDVEEYLARVARPATSLGRSARSRPRRRYQPQK